MTSSGKYNYKAFNSTYYAPENFIDGAPKSGECASDFQAKRIDGTPARLSDWAGKTIVLETGSRTCPMFGSNITPMNRLAEHVGRDDVVFLVLYTREAHPGWRRPAHQSDADKKESAKSIASEIDTTRIILVDDIAGSAHQRWGLMPNASFVIGPDGVVLYRMDWSQADVLARILMADDIGAAIEQEHERNHQDMDSAKARHVFGYLFEQSGLNAIWHVLREIPGMSRQHKAADGHYLTPENSQYQPMSSSCPGWN